MSDRTQFAVGQTSFSVPKLFKRTVQVLSAVIMTALASLAVIVLNHGLTAQGGWMKGIAAWTAFIQRSDILGTIVLTAIVTVATIYWQRGPNRK
ncbi:MAG: hypothetical protein GC150_04175 [Rhizobiales bacterium]|nr:hypothetical protein [Hyphomicrobiales bacterium]